MWSVGLIPIVKLPITPLNWWQLTNYEWIIFEVVKTIHRRHSTCKTSPHRTHFNGTHWLIPSPILHTPLSTKDRSMGYRTKAIVLALLFCLLAVCNSLLAAATGVDAVIGEWVSECISQKCLISFINMIDTC